MSKNKKCVVSLATKNGRYVDGLARLSNSLRDNADGIDFLGFVHESSVGAPSHIESNYGFKISALNKAINEGYEQLLWLDTSVWAVAPIEPIFDLITENGYWFEGSGCWLGDWCNDKTLDYYDLTRTEAKTIPMCQGGFMGFDLTHAKGKQIFYRLSSDQSAGFFNGEWSNHRHDQSCLSSILHHLDLKFSHAPEYVQYGGIYDKILNDKIIFKCQGI